MFFLVLFNSIFLLERQMDDDEWMNGWVDGWSSEADGHFDIFHPHEPIQISIFKKFLNGWYADVGLNKLFTHEPQWLDPVEWKSKCCV